MILPHRDPIQLGPTPYEVFQDREGIPSVTGFFVEDLMDVAVKPWARMGALGCYLNMGEQQKHDAYICEIPLGKQALPQRHLFETLVYIHKGRGATTVWFEESAKQTFEWSAGAIFAIPLNVCYQHFNASNEPLRLLAGTNAPHPNAARVFINWLLSRKGQIALQKTLATSESPPDSLRNDIPKDDVPYLNRRVEGVKYLDTSKPEWQEMKPVLDIMNEALKAAGKS